MQEAQTPDHEQRGTREEEPQGAPPGPGLSLGGIDQSADHPGHDGTPNEHLGAVTVFSPLSRRLELGITVPFIDALNPGQTSFGDLTVTPRLMLSETRDLGVTTGVAIRTSTGDTDTGNGQTRVDPFVAVWADLGHAWQLRSGFDVNVVTNRDVLPGLPDAVSWPAEALVAVALPAAVSLTEKVTPAATRAAPSRHTPPTPTGDRSMPECPIRADMAFHCVVFHGMPRLGQTPSLMGDSMKCQLTAAAATMPATRAVARSGDTGAPAVPAAAVSTISG